MQASHIDGARYNSDATDSLGDSTNNFIAHSLFNIDVYPRMGDEEGAELPYFRTDRELYRDDRTETNRPYEPAIAMNSPQFQKSIFSLKSWLCTPATKSDRFARATDVHADGLIIDLEDAVAPSSKHEARAAALRYLEQIPAEHLPFALRINSPDTRFGLDDVQGLLISSANPDYLILPFM